MRIQKAITLLELIVALTILSTVLTIIYSVFVTSIKTMDLIRSETQADRIGSQIMAIISRDIRATYLYQVDGGFLGQDQGQTDSLDFITSVDSLMPSGTLKSDLCEVGYFLKPSSESGTYILYRREDFYIDDKPLEGGSIIKVYDRIVTFNLRYFGKQGFQDSWNSKKEKALPKAVEVTMQIRTSPRPTKGQTNPILAKETFKTVVAPAAWYEEMKVDDVADSDTSDTSQEPNPDQGG